MKLEIIQPNSHDLQRDHNIKFALCDHVLYYTVNNKKKRSIVEGKEILWVNNNPIYTPHT